MDLINKIKSLQEKTSNEYLKVACKSYINSIQSATDVNENLMAKNFLNHISDFTLNENDKNYVLAEFKVYQVSSLDVSENIKMVLEDSEYAVDQIYEERLGYIKKLSDDNQGQDYLIIERVVEVLDTLPKEDLVIKEALQNLSSKINENIEDIRVLNFVDYLKNSTDSKKYKKQYDNVFSSMNEFLLKPDIYTRTNLIEALRHIPQTNEIKTFANYMVAKELADNTNNHNKEIGNNTFTSGRIKVAYFNNIGKSVKDHGLGKIVLESIGEAEKMLSEMPRRHVIDLLSESLSNETKNFNRVERSLYNKILREQKVNDMGIKKSISEIKVSPVYSKFPAVKKVLDSIYEKVTFEGVPDFKLVLECLRVLEGHKYDVIVEKCFNRLYKNYLSNKGVILSNEFLELTEKENKLGLYNNLREDVKDYIQEPSPLKRQAILENYKMLSFDNNVKNYLSHLNTVEDGSLNKTATFISNSNPNDYVVEKVYSFIETDGLKTHFSVNGKYFIRKEDELSVVNENRISTKVKTLTDKFRAFNLKVVNESTMTGYYNGNKLIIESTESGNQVSINGNSYQNMDKEMMSLAFRNAYTKDYQAMLEFYNLYENVDSFAELDFVNKITYRKNPKVYCYVYRLDESIMLHFVNESTHYEKFSKTKKPKNAIDWVKNYMGGFDMSKSIMDFMGDNEIKISNLSENANKKLEKIKKYDEVISNLKKQLDSTPDGHIKKLIIESLDSVEMEVDKLRDSYAEDVEALDSYENVESGYEVGMKVQDNITGNIGRIISVLPNSNCLVQFEDGTQKECMCSDLSGIVKDYEPEITYGEDEYLEDEEDVNPNVPEYDENQLVGVDEMTLHRYNKFKKKD